MLPNCQPLNNFWETLHVLFLLDLTSLYFLQFTTPKLSPWMPMDTNIPALSASGHIDPWSKRMSFRLEVGSRLGNSDLMIINCLSDSGQLPSFPFPQEWTRMCLYSAQTIFSIMLSSSHAFPFSPHVSLIRTSLSVPILQTTKVKLREIN